MKTVKVIDKKETGIDRIMAIALESKMPGVNIQAIMQIINATPNATLAMEVLLGIYEPEEVALESEIKHSEIIGLARFKEYNMWIDKVQYEYDYHQFVVRYFKTQEDADSCATADESYKNSISKSWEDIDYKVVKKFYQGIKRNTDYTSLSSWNANAPVQVDNREPQMEYPQ